VKAQLLGDERLARSLRPRLAPLLSRLGESLGQPRSTLAVLLTDDEGIRDYNRRFRSVDEPTDVLSFPTGSGDPGASGHYLGDLVISSERAAAQAAEIGHGVEEEIEVLVLHGVLHLLGHDHETDEGQMRSLEARLARELFGGMRGLIERVEDPDAAGG